MRSILSVMKNQGVFRMDEFLAQRKIACLAFVFSLDEYPLMCIPLFEIKAFVIEI